MGKTIWRTLDYGRCTCEVPVPAYRKQTHCKECRRYLPLTPPQVIARVTRILKNRLWRKATLVQSGTGITATLGSAVAWFKAPTGMSPFVFFNEVNSALNKPLRENEEEALETAQRYAMLAHLAEVKA